MDQVSASVPSRMRCGIQDRSKPVLSGRNKTAPMTSAPEDVVADIASNTATFLLPAGMDDEEDAPLTRRIISSIVNRCCFRVALPSPRCKLVAEKANIKEEVQSFASEAGKGYSNWEARRKRRESRVSAACRVEREEELALREAKLAARVYCCNVQCPETARFCNREFLTANGLVQHKVGGSQHTWERRGGVNSSDLAVLAASKPGGYFAVWCASRSCVEHDDFGRCGVGGWSSGGAGCGLLYAVQSQGVNRAVQQNAKVEGEVVGAF